MNVATLAMKAFVLSGMFDTLDLDDSETANNIRDLSARVPGLIDEIIKLDESGELKAMCIAHAMSEAEDLARELNSLLSAESA